MPVQPATLVELFANCVARGAQETALYLPDGDSGFHSLTWNDLAQEVRRLAAGLRQANIQPGDRIVQVSENRYEWIVVDRAVQMARAVHVAVHAGLSAQQIAFQIADSDARIVLLSGAEQVAKLASVGEKLPRGLQFYSYEPVEVSIAGQEVLPFGDLFVGLGKKGLEGIEEESLAHTRSTDLATILYTSGTTGEAKGVMLSHGNLLSNAIGTYEAFEFAADELALSWLPWSHIFARTCDLYVWMYGCYKLAAAESREKIIANCGTLKPTLMTGVPYFYDKVYRYLNDRQLIGPTEPGGSTHLQKLLGGRMRVCNSGGAALPNHVAEFFWREGVPLVQGYGLTESSPVITVSTPAHTRIGSVGRVIRDVQVLIAADGEILTRGPHVMQGYWKRPTDTAEAIRDGWLLTGDLGALDSDGYLTITGRKKELIVTAGGKNIAPVFLESLLTEDPLISQAIVIGDGRKYLSALIVPAAEALRSEIIARQIPVTTPAEALVHPQVLQLYRQRVDARLAAVAGCEQISRFRLIPRAFTLDQEELTPTLKLRRKTIHEHFSSEIEAIYADQDL